MTDEMIPYENLPDPLNEADREKEKRKMNQCFNRIGWGMLTTMLIWLSLTFSITFLVTVIDLWTKTSVLTDLYNQYLLLINEATLAIGIAIGFFVIRTAPKAEPCKKPITVGRFMQILCICFAVSYIGNIIGTIFLTYWNLITGNESGNELEQILEMTEPWMIFLSVCILAPLLEELVFRKFLIDRMRPYGELVSILVSALLFALFHQNFSQFVYTVSAGVMLGFLYYRTGNYWLTTLLHAIFNGIGGFLPMLFASDVLAFSEEIAALESTMGNASSEEMLSLMMPILTEYALPLLLYGFYLLILGVVNITGIVFLIIRFRQFRAEKGTVVLNAPETFRAIFRNPGMICTLILLGLLTLLSLFTV